MLLISENDVLDTKAWWTMKSERFRFLSISFSLSPYIQEIEQEKTYNYTLMSIVTQASIPEYVCLY